jgi:ABC-type nitrate/sulfonate/bicarbonate transport system substrate-binding protein
MIGRAACALLVALAMPVHAMRTLEVIVFPGGFNWPLWVAQEKGFFRANEVDVRISPTPNSVFQIQGLVAGKFDIAISTIDNVVAYQEGQGEAELATAPDLFAFMGGQYGAVRLVAQPEFKSIGDLKGRALAVDAATTGYAFVLKKILAQAGLGDGDYTLERLGGTAARAEALMQGKTAATILTSPLEILPESRGYQRLANAVDAIGPYQAVVGVARRAWAQENEAALVGYIRAYVAALDWLSEPANRDEAVAIYRKQLPQASEASVRKAWEVLLTGNEGFQKKGKIDPAGVTTVLQLRSEYGRPQKKLDDPDRYIDERYYRAARQEAGATSRTSTSPLTR